MVDTIAVVGADEVERFQTPESSRNFLMLEEGRKIVADRVTGHVGGGGINSAVCLQRLGFSVATVVKLGRDDRGRLVRQTLAMEGIDTRWVCEDPDRATGASVIISSHDHNAAIITYRGANSVLVPADVPSEKFSRSLVYVAGLSDQSADILPTIIDRTAAPETFIAINPGVRQLAKRFDALYDALPRLSQLSVNALEAAEMVPQILIRQPAPSQSAQTIQETAFGALMQQPLTKDGCSMSLPHFFEALISTGLKSVVVTDGQRGCYAASQEGVVFCSALIVPVAGTAGAGDAFNATFAACRVQGHSIEDCLIAARTNAASVIGHADTLSGLLTLEQLRAAKGAAEQPVVRTWRYDGQVGKTK